MQTFDAIGMQINIDDNWPSDQEARKKLRQCSDYIEIVNDLNECKRLVDLLQKLNVDHKHEFEFMKSMGLSPIPPGIVGRSIDSSIHSRYGRCFNSGDSRSAFDEAKCLKILGDQLYIVHKQFIERRNEVIAHADSVLGRQPIRVVNWKDPKSNWQLNSDTSIDEYPHWSQERVDAVKQCCDRFIEHSEPEARKAWNNFKRKLSEEEAETLRNGHYSKDDTGASYHIVPPASTRK